MCIARLRHPVAVSSADDEYGYHFSRYGGHPAQGYKHGMAMDHRAYGAAGVGAGSSSVLTTSSLAPTTWQTPELLIRRRRWL